MPPKMSFVAGKSPKIEPIYQKYVRYATTLTQYLAATIHLTHKFSLHIPPIQKREFLSKIKNTIHLDHTVLWVIAPQRQRPFYINEYK
jgi:hypothetical protein